MPAAAVKLSRPQQSIAGEAFVRRLRHSDCLVLAVSVDAVHYHILMRCPPGDVRWVLGLAKKHASHELRSAGLAGRVWAKRCGVRTVRDRAHQLRVYRYILAHARRGAWTWNFKDHPDE
jgi:REP element-mobilizing transposase RayT